MNKITTVVARNASNEVVTTIGIDLAKNVFAMHSVNATDEPILVRSTVPLD